jgi:hypothetical protein
LLGILVCGDNHFIVEGPEPNRATAVALARHWSLIRIDAKTPPGLEHWRIITRAFRENLEWAIIVQGAGQISAAVAQLLEELRERGIDVQELGFG